MNKSFKVFSRKKLTVVFFLVGFSCFIGVAYFTDMAVGQASGALNNQASSPAVSDQPEAGAENPASSSQNNSTGQDSVQSESAAVTTTASSEETAEQQTQSNNTVAPEGSEQEQVVAESEVSAEETQSAAEIFDAFLSNSEEPSDAELQSALTQSIQSFPARYAEFLIVAIERGLEQASAADVLAQAVRAGAIDEEDANQILFASTAGINNAEGDAASPDVASELSFVPTSAGRRQSSLASISPSIPPTLPPASASPAR